LIFKEDATSGGLQTAKYAVYDTYGYDLRENWVRRGIALFIDAIIVFSVMLLVGFVIIAALMSGNPLLMAVGPYADNINAPLPEAPNIFLQALLYAVVSIVISTLYFMLLESGGRRTLGKKLMHLEIVRGKGATAGISDAFLRNIPRILLGALGGFLLGGFGWGLFVGIGSFIDYKVGGPLKEDLRQRLSEAHRRTWVSLEDEETGFGKISLPEDVKKSRERPVKESLPGPEKKPGTPLLKPKEGSEEKEKDAEAVEEKKGFEKAPSLEERKEPPEDEEEPGDEMVLDEGEEEKKIPFWKRLFSGVKKDEPGEAVVEEEGGTVELPPRDTSDRDELVLSFMMDFDISEERAQGLYDMGYRTREELKEAIPQDLMMIDGINPTISKRIIKAAGGGE